MAKLTFLHFLLILYFYSLFQIMFGEHQTHSGFSLKMLHWNSPELPSYKPNRTHEELMEELMHMSNVRVKALKHLIVLNSSYFPNDYRPITPTLERISPRGIFLVQVGIGTSQTSTHGVHTFQPNYLVLETASDHTWTQCEGCSPCFHQRGPLFSWRNSLTYRVAPCGHCPGSCQSDHCVINLQYGVDGYIRGIAARDTFTFQSVNGTYKQIPNMDFICVFGTQGYKETMTEADIESGVFALGPQGYLNLMRPIHNNTEINDGRFSFCLPPFDRPIQQPMYLRFGRDIGHLKKRKSFQSTPILRGPPGTPFYYLELLDLSVGETRLGMDSQVFSLKRDGLGGCFIDTSIGMTYLPRVAYDKLEQHLSQQNEAMNHGQVTRSHMSPLPHLRFCYEYRSQAKPESPSISFHFGGNANLKVAKPMGHYTHGSRQLHCLQILPDVVGSGTTIIGAMQLADHRFIYDTRSSVLQFAWRNCARYN